MGRGRQRRGPNFVQEGHAATIQEPTPGAPQPATAAPPDINRPTRNHRVPRRYCRPTHANAEGSGEEFDLNVVSDDGDPSDEAEDNGSDSRRRHVPNAQATAVNTATTAVTTTTDPLGTGHSQSARKKNVAYDIRHFFRKEKDHTICSPCE
jgi:hypothetical protein